MKRIVSIIIIVIMLTGIAVPCAYSADKVNEAEPSSLTVLLEKIGGATGCLFGRILKSITFTDETRIKKAKPREAAGEKSGTPLFSGDAEQTLSAETWCMVELSYESEKSYADPFNEVTLDLLLYGNGRLYTVPAFWDGGNTWRIRFVCPAAGIWQCKTVCSDESNTALHNRTAQVDCSAYSGNLEIYKHGFVTTRYGEKYLTYEDGTPFYYLGDTHWQLAQETPEIVAAICEKRVEQGFTVYQSQPNDCAFNSAVTENIGENALDDLRDFDQKFRIISENGLIHAHSQFFWPLSGMTRLINNHGGWTEPKITGMLGTKKVIMPDLSDEAKEYLEKLARYWVARYSAFPVIWTLGQEIDNDPYQDETSPWNAVNNPYKYVAEYLAKYDPYDHPVTAHQESTGDTVAYGNGLGSGELNMIWYPGAAASAFRNVEAHTIYAAQWHPNLTKRDDFMSARDYWYNGQGKPVVNYEGLYCYLWTKNFGARAQAWASYLTGLYGCSWGGQPTWAYQNSFDINVCSDDGVDLIRPEEKQAATWRDALEYPSSYQVGYMRSFMEQSEWYNLIPRFNNLAYFTPASDVYSYCASNKDNTEMVVYFYSFTDLSVAEKANTKNYGGIMTGTVGCLEPDAAYAYTWFNPVTGEYAEEGTFIASVFGTYYLGNKPSATDWVIRITKLSQ
ncbi:MAG: DUF4038 domain-containing protein [Clostridia bacterium]|nr:DUF4038 domain-containing protein [Clostridia bacterium]